eukprot:scaffold1930_cov346-Prasinococcus_capsulatus_cf.AAC.9
MRERASYRALAAAHHSHQVDAATLEPLDDGVHADVLGRRRLLPEPFELLLRRRAAWRRALPANSGTTQGRTMAWTRCDGNAKELLAAHCPSSCPQLGTRDRWSRLLLPTAQLQRGLTR